MDGDNYWTMFWRIAMPLARPGAHRYRHLPVPGQLDRPAPAADLPALRQAVHALALGLFQLLNQYGPSGGGSGQYQLIIAGLVISTIPMIIVFFVGQRYFVEGIVTQGSKG